MGADGVRGFVRAIQARAVVSGIIIGAVLATVATNGAAYGFMAGVAVSVVNFQLMAVDAYQAAEKSPGRARSFIIGRFLVRYAVMFGFLALVATRTEWNIVAAFVGVFHIQMLLVGERLYDVVRRMRESKR